MTLYRQIAILVSCIFLILLTTILMVSFKIVKDSAQKELYENAQNTVSSLSLSIGSTDMTQGSIETMINASFDNGNYERITFIDIDNKVVYERNKEIITLNIPHWFEKMVVFDVPVAKAKISSGWQVIGTLEILNNKSVTYFQLYKIMTHMVMQLGFACIIFLIVLSYIFHVILRPLLEIEKQAQAVMKNEFVIQEKLPWTKEFRIVILSINTMVRKFESIFKTASETLSENKELLYNDDVMKIPNRRYFILKATEYLTNENGKNYGTAIIMSIKKANDLNHIIGHKGTDVFLFEFAQYLKEVLKVYNDSLVCRINGTEIIILLPEKYMKDVQVLVTDILAYINQKIEELKLDKSDFGIDMGMCEYEAQHNIGEFFSLIDYALEQAKLIPSGHCYELLNNKVAIAKDRWRQIILDGFKNDSFEIMYRKVIDTASGNRHHNVVSFALNNDNESYFYGTLIAPVVELGMVQDVYMYVIKKVLLSSNTQNNTPLTIQISSQFIEDIDAYGKLKTLLKEVKNQINNEIIFEIPESVINKHFESSMHFVRLFKEYGFGFGINSFMAYSEDYHYLKEIKPIFVKADKQYILDAQQNINVLKIVLDSLGIEFIATGVNELSELEALNKKGITVVAGMVVDKI